MSKSISSTKQLIQLLNIKIWTQTDIGISNTVPIFESSFSEETMCILLASVYKMGNLCSVKWSFLIIHKWSCRSTIALCCGNMRPLRLVSAYISYYIMFFNEMTRVLMKQFPDMVNPGMTLSYVKKVWNRILSFILSTKCWLFITWFPNTPEPIWMWLWFNNQRVWRPKQRHGMNIHEPYVQEVFKIGCTHCMCRVFCGNVYKMRNIVWYWILKQQRMQIRIEKTNYHLPKLIVAILWNALLPLAQVGFMERWLRRPSHKHYEMPWAYYLTWCIPWGLFMPFHRLVGFIKRGLVFAC